MTSSPSPERQVSAKGGEPELILPLDDVDLFGPQLLPDGRSILVTVTDTADWSRGEVIVVSLATRQRTVVVSDGRSAKYVRTGHLVYGVGDALYAQPFSLRSLELTGSAVPVANGVHTLRGRMHYAVSPDGTLAYLRARPLSHVLAWVDRQGVETPISMPPSAYAGTRLAPDGRRVVLDDQNDANDIWILDLDSGIRTRMTIGEAGGSYPIWTRDGGRIAYQQRFGSLAWKAADNTGTPQALVASGATPGDRRPTGPLSPYEFRPDGTLLVRHPGGIAVRSPDGDLHELIDESTPQRIVYEFNASVSPNGRWIAYQSNESGEYQVYVRPFPNVADGRSQVSNAGGGTPRWASDAELLYVEPESPSLPLGPGRMISVAVDPDVSILTVRSRARLIDWPYPSPTIMRSWDLSADGQRFLVIRTAENTAPRFVVVRGWFEELRRIR